MSIDLRRAQPTHPGILTGFLIGLIAVFALLSVGVALSWQPLLNADESVALWARELTESHPALLRASQLAAALFNTWPVLAASWALALIAAILREWRIATWIMLSAVLTPVGNRALKLIFERDRPVWEEPLDTIGGYGFPSGHAAAAGMFFTVLALLTIIKTGRGWRRRLLLALWIASGVFVAMSRVFLGVHYLSDVIAGLAWGIGVTVALWLLIATDSTRQPSELAVATGTGARRVAVVLNPVKVGPVDDFKAKVRTVAVQEGWTEPLWYETTVDDPGHGQATGALEAGVDLIIAAGGDGTVRAVCEEAARTGVAVAIIAQGTGNLLARNLGVPLNVRDALEVAFSGQDKAIDLARISTDAGVETSFLVMAGLGMDAMIMTEVDDRLKDKVGWIAYFVSGIKALRFPGAKMTIWIDDDEPQTFRARTVVVGNVGYLQAGLPLIPQARIDDGELDVVVIAPRRLFGWVVIAWRVVARRKHTNERLDRFIGKRVTIEASEPTPMQLDGDPVGEGTKITAEVRPGVVLVRVPVTPVTQKYVPSPRPLPSR